METLEERTAEMHTHLHTLFMLRPDLDLWKVVDEVNKEVERVPWSTIEYLQKCIDLAKAGYPMPWEKTK
jgi:hypothetical protein